MERGRHQKACSDLHVWASARAPPCVYGAVVRLLDGQRCSLPHLKNWVQSPDLVSFLSPLSKWFLFKKKMATNVGNHVREKDAFFIVGRSTNQSSRRMHQCGGFSEQQNYNYHLGHTPKSFCVLLQRLLLGHVHGCCFYNTGKMEST